jgi:hypothetical protein
MATAPAPRFGGLYRSLLITAVLPLALVLLLQHRFGVPTVPALAIAAIFPLGDIAFSWARSRRLEPLGALMLVVIVAGIVLSLISGDVRFSLIKESFGTGIVSFVFLGSLLAPRPLVFWLARQFSTGGNPKKAAEWDSLWQYPNFRHSMRVSTAVWGFGYLLDAIARIIFAFTLPASWTIVLSPISAIGVTIFLVLWTIAYRRARVRAAGVQG